MRITSGAGKTPMWAGNMITLFSAQSPGLARGCGVRSFIEAETSKPGAFKEIPDDRLWMTIAASNTEQFYTHRFSCAFCHSARPWSFRCAAFGVAAEQGIKIQVGGTSP